MLYALIRYHERLFGTLPNDQIFTFITNKALSFSAIAMIALAVAARPLARWKPSFFSELQKDRRTIGLTGFGLAIIHSILSLTVLTPAYFDKHFNDAGRMTLAAELSMLAGAIALALLIWQSRLAPADDRDDRRTLRRLGLGVLSLGAIHVAALGWNGWLDPSAWPGGMPPITLCSFAVALWGLFMGLLPGGKRG